MGAESEKQDMRSIMWKQLHARVHAIAMLRARARVNTDSIMFNTRPQRHQKNIRSIETQQI